MKKAFDQTVRDLKRGVNKKVLKVRGIEQKVLDSTSNESWGPHGALLEDIAQATKNHHEYKIIMHVLWKRTNDTGKNWRHVYKALSVLEYLVVNGSEHVIDDVREHAHQLLNLSDFQYIDSSGRDQGSNVRKKAHTLVALVNDKERILEIRQKVLSNRDRYRTTSSTSSHGGYGHEKERETRYKDDGRSRSMGLYGLEGDHNGGYSYEHYGRDGYTDDSFKGSKGNDDYRYGSRKNGSHSRNRSSDDDDLHSSRSGGGRADGLPGEQRPSAQSYGAPPSYEEAIRDSQKHVQEARNRDGCIEAFSRSSSSSAPRASSPNQGSSPFAPTDSSSYSTNQGLGSAPTGVYSPVNDNNNNSVDEFDPHVSVAAASPAASSLEMDIFGLASASASDLMYSSAAIANSTEVDRPSYPSIETDFVVMPSASGVFNQPGENPFGDPFIATRENSYSQGESFAPVTSFNSSSFIGGAEVHPPTAPKMGTSTDFDFDLDFGVTCNSSLNDQQSSFSSGANFTPEAPMAQPNDDISGFCSPQTGSATTGPMPQIQLSGPTHIHANVMPQLGPSAPSHLQGNFLPHSGPAPYIQGNFLSQSVQLTPSHIRGTYFPQSGPSAPSHIQGSFLPGSGLQAPLHGQGNFLPQSGPPPPLHGQGNFLPESCPPPPSHIQGSFLSQSDPPVLSNTQENFLSQSGPPAESVVQGNLLSPSDQPAPSQETEISPPSPSHVEGNCLDGSDQPAPFSSQATQSGSPAVSHVQGNPLPLSGQAVPFPSQATQLDSPAPSEPLPQSDEPDTFASQAAQLGPPASSLLQGNTLPQSGQTGPFASQATQLCPQAPSHVQGNPLPQSVEPAAFASQARHLGPPAWSHVQGNPLPLSGQPAPFASQATQFGPPAPSHVQGNPLSQSGVAAPSGSQATQFISQGVRPITPMNDPNTQLYQLSQPAPQAPSTIEVSTPAPTFPVVKTASSTQKFEPKSSVWADTLSRGLVNLNISGPKTNPHADIGIDFDTMNRKERREERKASAASVCTTTAMGKAMGTGSGIGRTGANDMSGLPNPMIGPRMGMGMMGGSGMGMGMMGGSGMGMGMMGAGGYGGNMGQQPMGMMNMGMNPGMPSRPPMGFPPGSGGMPGVGYNPTMGMGNYGPQQPYGGGYR